MLKVQILQITKNTFWGDVVEGKERKYVLYTSKAYLHIIFVGIYQCCDTLKRNELAQEGSFFLFSILLVNFPRLCNSRFFLNDSYI